MPRMVWQLYFKDTADATFVKKNAEMPTGKTATDPVTFQDLIDLGIIAEPTP